MKRLLGTGLVLLLGHSVCFAQPRTAMTNSAAWLLSYRGKSTNALVMDKRFPAFLRTHISNTPLAYWNTGRKSTPSRDALEFLHGPDDDISIVDNRYVIAAACVPHDCMDRGLLWVDTSNGATLFVASTYQFEKAPSPGHAHVWLFSNQPVQANQLPATFLDAVAHWSGEPNGDNSKTPITEVTLVEPDSAQIKLTPADVHAWNATKTAGN